MTRTVGAANAEQPAQSREMQRPADAESPESADLLVPAGTGDSADNVPEFLLAPRGLELSPLALSKTPISETRGAESGAPKDENTPLDLDLAYIQERWPKLPEHVKAAVLALVRTE